jgi:hypothetical protein
MQRYANLRNGFLEKNDCLFSNTEEEEDSNFSEKARGAANPLINIC